MSVDGIERNVDMLCKKPYMKNPVKPTRNGVVMSSEMRLAATPFPCGQCLPCRINKSREWTHRLMLEQMVHGDSVFLTLTYNDECVPINYSLYPKDLTDFWKRLRKSIYPRKIRYFAVGEYGDRGRPHYHAIVFGLSELDAEKVLKAWNMGYIHVGDVNKDSISYVTKYVVKGDNKFDFRTIKKLGSRCPEFMRVSKVNGGLGFQAIYLMAKAMRDNKDWERRIVREFHYGKKKKMPLGRYLTKKLAEIIGISETEFEEAVYEWQETIFNKHLTDDSKDGGYLKRIIDEDEGKRISLIKRNKLFRKKGKL